MKRCSRCCTRSSPARRKLLTRRGALVEEEGSTYMADSDNDSDEARVLRPLQAAACTYRIAFGPRAGQKVLTLQGAMPRKKDFKQTLCADIDGNSAARPRALRRRRPAGTGATVPLHHPPASQAAPGQRPGPSPGTNSPPDCLCPGSALANERVQTNAAGQVVLKVKTAWRDGGGKPGRKRS